MSASIREILQGLSASNQELLRYAFETGLTNQFVIYTPGRFVGVNILPNFKEITIEQTAGRYAEGSINDTGNLPQD